MIELVPASRCAYINNGWANIHRLLAPPERPGMSDAPFGNILVFDDILFFPGFGFGMNPHANVEKLYIVREGELAHEDSAGNTLVLPQHSVQHIRAGGGYARELRNRSTKISRHIALWLHPRTDMKKTVHEVRCFSPLLWAAAPFPVGSGASLPRGGDTGNLFPRQRYRRVFAHRHSANSPVPD